METTTSSKWLLFKFFYPNLLLGNFQLYLERSNIIILLESKMMIFIMRTQLLIIDPHRTTLS